MARRSSLPMKLTLWPPRGKSVSLNVTRLKTESARPMARLSIQRDSYVDDGNDCYVLIR